MAENNPNIQFIKNKQTGEKFAFNTETGEKIKVRRKTVDVPPDKLDPQVGLPQFNKVEQQIQQRTAATPSITDRIKNYIVSSLSGIGQGQAGLELAGAIPQRVEAAVANPLMSIQQGEQGRVPPPQVLFNQFKQGLTGQRLGEVGDITRRALPEKIDGHSTEPLAATLGLIQSGIIADVGTGLKIKNGLTNINKSLNKLHLQKSIAKNNTFYLEQAKNLGKGVDTVASDLSRQYDDLFSKVGDNKIPQHSRSAFKEKLYNLSDVAKNKIKRDTKFDIRKLEANKITPIRIKDIKEIRTAIGKSIPKKVWKGIADNPTPQQIADMETYFDLGDLIADNAGNAAQKNQLLKLNQTFKQFKQKESAINRLIYSPDGEFKTNNLTDIFKESSQGQLNSINEFTQMFGDLDSSASEVLQSLKKADNAVKLKSKLKKAGLYIAGEEVLRRSINSINKNQSSSGGGDG